METIVHPDARPPPEDAVPKPPSAKKGHVSSSWSEDHGPIFLAMQVFSWRWIWTIVNQESKFFFTPLCIALGSGRVTAAGVVLGRQQKLAGISVWISREVLSFCCIKMCDKITLAVQCQDHFQLVALTEEVTRCPCILEKIELLKKKKKAIVYFATRNTKIDFSFLFSQ